MSSRTAYRMIGISIVFLAATTRTMESCGGSPENLPLLNVKGLEYEGAFRLPARKFGESELNFSQGPIAFNPDRKTLFIVGHTHQQAIAEFAIPDLVDSKVVADLNMADTPLQPFASILSRASGGNSQNNNRIGGMLHVTSPQGPQLLVNAYEYYDAPGDNTLSLLVVRNADDLAGSRVDGYVEVQGQPGHTAGWMSPIPDLWSSVLGGDFLMGNSSGIPIISRASVGPSAFVFDLREAINAKSGSTPVSTIKLLDFSLAHALHEDLMNESRNNDLWNHLSRAVFGVVVPGTRTYATFGHSGGNKSGIGYKNLRDDRSRSGGYSSFAVKDNYHYYWFWDVSDLARVRAGEMEPYEVRPYEYGILPTPFAAFSNQLGGGTFDTSTDRIYLTLQGADREQGHYANPPIVVVYKAVLESPDERR